MRKFLALVTVLTSTALVAPMAMAKTAPKARTTHSKRVSSGKAKSKVAAGMSKKESGQNRKN
jgi:hypothetical protein